MTYAPRPASSLCTVHAIRAYGDIAQIKGAIKGTLAGKCRHFVSGGAAARPKRVVVKPNWIQESDERGCGDWEAVITHPDVLLATVECVADAMGGEGTLSVCDAPHGYADFAAILGRGDLKTRLEALQGAWPKLRLEVMDLRREICVVRGGVVVERKPNGEDARGYALLNLGRDSLFYQHNGEGRYYGADYDTGEVNEHHRGETHEYLVANTALGCDLFINLPKMKTHKKTGITCALKNLVGVNGNKNWLPHYTEGGPSNGGDEFTSETAAHRLERVVKRLGRRMAINAPGLGPYLFGKLRGVGMGMFGDSDLVVRNGNWQGNDTCWRMALDLNRALLYGNPDGTWREAGQTKRCLTIVDGIIGGEGNGPLCPDPVDSGVMIVGQDPAVVDAVACRLMGFDPERVPIVREAFAAHRWPISNQTLPEIQVHDERVGKLVPLREVAPAVPGGFKPHFGWTNLGKEGSSER